MVEAESDFVRKALWFVEAHSRENISLQNIADASGVSPFHLTRTFATTIGVSLMRYVRARRLSEAAKLLVENGRNILEIALESGYGSHEAFTRAFREQFSLTPERFRVRGNLKSVALVEAITMDTIPLSEIEPPRFVDLESRFFLGTVEHYDCEAPLGIPNQWQNFGKYLGNIPGQIGDAAFGICYNFDEEGNFDYMCAVEVSETSNFPKELKTLQLPAQRYAVFVHKGHVSNIRATFGAVWQGWFAKAKEKPVPGANLERYGKEFDPRTGLGGIEIWIPVQE